MLKSVAENKLCWRKIASMGAAFTTEAGQQCWEADIFNCGTTQCLAWVEITADKGWCGALPEHTPA